MDELSALLDSPAFVEVLDDVSRRTGIRLFPEYPPALQAFDAKNVALAGVPVEALQNVLRSDRHVVTRFSIEKLRRFYGVAPDEEYPPGEEPGEEDRPSNIQQQGLSKGFLLLNLLEYYILNDRPDALDRFLKARRIPKAKQFAADLRNVFAAARAAGP